MKNVKKDCVVLQSLLVPAVFRQWGDCLLPLLRWSQILGLGQRWYLYLVHLLFLLLNRGGVRGSLAKTGYMISSVGLVFFNLMLSIAVCTLKEICFSPFPLPVFTPRKHSLSQIVLPILSVSLLHKKWHHVPASQPDCRIQKTQTYTTCFGLKA